MLIGGIHIVHELKQPWFGDENQKNEIFKNFYTKTLNNNKTKKQKIKEDYAQLIDLRKLRQMLTSSEHAYKNLFLLKSSV